LERPIVLCALEYEAAYLHKSDRLEREVSIHCTGPGIDAVFDFLLDLDGSDFGIVIFAGLSGALMPRLRVGDVRVARRVMSDDGEKWTATWPRDESASRGLAMCDLLTTRQVLRLPDERRAAHETTGAALVDTESVALAAWATRTSHKTWGIVRGVSDDVETTLPDGIDHWVGRNGRLRPWRVAYDLIRQPGSISTVRRLGDSSRLAMTGVVQMLEKLLCEEGRST
jgi:purine-nucleoside phosphorylase